ncbi:hypothetical protein N7489_005714 [Penicillium chrysogenum]|uniref:Uncharacterized protein n=1 Tax=Penicillium chrysogenum TaxID=5076 RepID=A0ABQ8WPB8_PENCH|nr:uncharacterized protein N7489_005714 [Penicillium chrysogenum]KAJ5245618.1 hypothetical protein N7489_005714 [Penicillium chrysogenum]KAJ5274291.1 hypothetical protein N7505_002836 [Penicillium chrysogenum]KAJ5284757.1 hypothetical protein N7524_000063 [Penicillium chrysogenum]KAJ6156001.1 hypothetical protein N7497_004886 [Penicillium chrysogenum]
MDQGEPIQAFTDQEVEELTLLRLGDLTPLMYYALEEGWAVLLNLIDSLRTQEEWDHELLALWQE